ncbi:hypothetical protein EJ06DRAFT_477561, partial [Trichodelitschia bisporula]
MSLYVLLPGWQSLPCLRSANVLRQGSVALAAGVVSWAYLERPNFYSAAVYLSQSNASLMILCNLALVCVGSFMYGLQQALFGPLRAIEVEHLYERGWFTVTEWAFAMSTFRDQFGVWFLAMFFCLFAGKVWGWIAEGRVESLEQQPPANPRLFHTRLVASLVVYLGFATKMFFYSLDSVLYEPHRPGMMIMFVFEFLILVISAASTIMRYGIWLEEYRVIKKQTAQLIEARRAEIRAARRAIEEAAASGEESREGRPSLEDLPNEEDIGENDVEIPGWEAKRKWLFVLDLSTDLFKLLSYVSFFSILTLFYGIPIYILRDLYLTFRSFNKRLLDYFKYQAATKNMNERYPDATAEDLTPNNTCIVCREDMRAWSELNQPLIPGQPPRPVSERQRAKKLPCGHILHFGCLQSWLERQQICPT